VNGVFAGGWLLPTNRRAGQDGESGGRSTIRGRLAFMKAEFEISNAQEQLWEAFAEALRDFLKARSRPDIGGPVGTAGLPERLAMRERDLTSDLESLRQRKAIIETFYAGLTEDQPRAADQLAPARAENLHHLRFCAGVRSRGMRTNCARSSQTQARRPSRFDRPVSRLVQAPVPKPRHLRIHPSTRAEAAGYRQPQPARPEWAVGCMEWLADQSRTS
jgi:hypothetical protein